MCIRDSYKAACTVFGGNPRVFRYYSQSDEISIDLLTAENSPVQGCISYSTLGLMHEPAGLRRSNIPLRLEIASACSNKFIHMPDLLSACGFEIASARFSCREGAVLTDFVNTYVPGSPMKHLLFLSDYPWEKSLPEITFDDKIVHWLYVLPVSEQELSLVRGGGIPPLLELFKKKQTDIFDLKRPSVI